MVEATRCGTVAVGIKLKTGGVLTVIRWTTHSTVGNNCSGASHSTDKGSVADNMSVLDARILVHIHRPGIRCIYDYRTEYGAGLSTNRGNAFVLDKTTICIPWLIYPFIYPLYIMFAT